MNIDKKKIIGLIIGVILFISLIFGVTYAYLRTTVTNNNISGKSYNISASLTLTAIKTGNLIPVSDSLITTSLNGNYPCEDARDGYNICSLYRVVLTNRDAATIFNGYLGTNTGTTYTTNNLKYQLFTHSTNYTAVSSPLSINMTTNSKNYFILNNNMIDFNVASGVSTPVTMEYYLVIWLSDNGNQTVDANKTYVGSLTFETINGGMVVADFNT